MRRTVYLVALFLLGDAQIAGWCFTNECLGAEPPGIVFVDERGETRSVSNAELAKLPRRSVKVTTPDSQSAEYDGIQISELAQHLGVVLGKELRGPRVASYLLFEAEDGYRVVLAIAEVDPATTDKIVLLADRKNGEALAEKEGPFRLVIPDEKRPVRWIRMIKKISVRGAALDGESSRVK